MEKFLKKCGGCGSKKVFSLKKVRDKENSEGHLCSSCRNEYRELLLSSSSRRFWMCGECRFRILAGTKIDDAVDPHSLCPNCKADVNMTLVNLKNNKPVRTDSFGHPVD